MKLMPCPLNGARNIDEFICQGPVKNGPGAHAPAEAWADFIFMEDNVEGPVAEWWLHVPSVFWFIAERDTRTGDILKTWTVEAYRKERGL